jgi:hypothetical protein
MNCEVWAIHSHNTNTSSISGYVDAPFGNLFFKLAISFSLTTPIYIHFYHGATSQIQGELVLCVEEIIVARWTHSKRLLLRASFFEPPRVGWPWKLNLNHCLSLITVSDKGDSPIKPLPFKELKRIKKFYLIVSVNMRGRISSSTAPLF